MIFSCWHTSWCASTDVAKLPCLTYDFTVFCSEQKTPLCLFRGVTVCAPARLLGAAWTRLEDLREASWRRIGCLLRREGRSVALRSVARSLDRSVARSLDPDRSVARSLDRSMARSLDRSISRPLVRFGPFFFFLSGSDPGFTFNGPVRVLFCSS